MSFDFGRMDNHTRKVWPRIRIQEVSGSELAIFVAGFIDRHIFPIVRQINDLDSLLTLLVSNQEPTPWFASGPGARAAQIVALATQVGMERNRIRSFLEPYERLIAVDLIGAKVDQQHPIDGYLDNYIDQLLSDLHSKRLPVERIEPKA